MRIDVLSLVASLGIADLIDEGASAFCQALGVAAVVAPLLVVFGLRVGIVDTIRADILDDPDNLRVVSASNASFSEAWFEEWRADPDVAFLAPQVHLIASNLEFRTSAGGERSEEVAQLKVFASRPGDPLLPDALTGLAEGEVALTQSAMERLKVTVGEHVYLVASQERDTGMVRASVTLAVVGRVPRTVWGIDGALVDESLLREAWLWELGQASDVFGAGAARSDPVRFPSFRLYATSLEALEPLATRLNAAGVRVRANFAQARRLQRIERGLATVLSAIALAGVVGVTGALASGLWANVTRKRPVLAGLRASGLPRGACAVFPIVQGMALAGLGWAMGVGAFLLIAWQINIRFASVVGMVEPCRLHAVHLASSLVLMVAVALLATVAASRSALSVDPAEGFEDG